MVDSHEFVVSVPDGVSTPSGLEFKPGEDDGGNESDKHPDLVPEAISSKRRSRGLPKPTREAITQARHDLGNYVIPATPAIGGKRAHEVLSDEQSVLGR